MRTIKEYDQFLNEDEDYRQKLWKLAGSAFSQMLSGKPLVNDETGANGSGASRSRIKTLSNYSSGSDVVLMTPFGELNLASF